ncbi:MAG: hypothetical protein JWM37_606 [Candidatus Saccharibacteria bacterium]|nr:hypothetical protein [Candidatus Saccharibacteria bacterium]
MAKKTYQDLRTELDEVLLKLQDPNCGVEEAVKLYERGLALTAELRDLLEASENKLTKLASE